MQNSIIGGCVNETLISEATSTGKRFRNAVRRGDFRSATHAFDAGDHSVGYPYMTQAEYTAAKAAFVKAAR